MEKILNKIIGERIKAGRTEKGLKQTDLAQTIDSTPASISNIENGLQTIQLIDLYKIAERLDKEVYHFLPNLKEFKEAVPSIDKERGKLSPGEAAFVDSLRKGITKEE
jgi:transcriptional regulator with XRE-family HTH domain